MLIELGIYAFVALVAVPFLIKWLAREDYQYTEGLSNYVKFTERAGVFDHMIPEVPGYILENPDSRDAEFRKAEPGESQPLSLLNIILHHFLGIYFYGIYPFKKIRKVRIKKTWENLEGTGPQNWIRQGPEVDEPGIRHTFPRVFVFTDVELSDRTKVNLKVVTKIRVVKPYIPVYEFGNDFFTQAGSIIQSQVIDHLIDLTVDNGEGGKRKLTIDDFINLKKGEVAGFLKVDKDDLPDGTPSELNQILIGQVGLRIDGININDWDPADEDTVRAIRQRALERLEGEARVTKAEKDAEVTIIAANAYKKKTDIESDADAGRIEKIGRANGSRVTQVVTAFAVSKADPNVVATEAGNVLEMQAVADTKLITLVKDSAKAVLPVGGSR